MKNSFYHAVTLIGFGVSDHDENEKYYEIQNSAGDDWGEDGYGYVSRDLFERYSYPINARIEGPGSPPSPPRRVWTRRARQLQPQPPQPQPPPPQLVIVYTRRPCPPQPQPPQPQPPQ